LIKIQEPLPQGPKPRSVKNQDFSTISYSWLLLITLQSSCRFVLIHAELQRKGQTAPKKKNLHTVKTIYSQYPTWMTFIILLQLNRCRG